MITIFYTKNEGEIFTPIRTTASLTDIKKGLRRGILLLPEQTIRFFSVLLPNGDIYDIGNGYRDISLYHPALTSSKKKIFRTIYKAIFFSGRVNKIGKLGVARQIVRKCLTCGQLPLVELLPGTFAPETEGTAIHIGCAIIGCNQSYYNTDFWNMKSAAKHWNKRGRKYILQRIK